MIHPESSPSEDIKLWFINDRVHPEDGVPAFVSHGSLGVPFPLRDSRPLEAPVPREAYPFDELRLPEDKGQPKQFNDTVSVLISDSIKALRVFERHQAAEWYIENFGPNPDAEYEVVFPTSVGRIMPADLMHRILPGLEYFDAIDNED